MYNTPSPTKIDLIIKPTPGSNKFSAAARKDSFKKSNSSY
jgi:hypothetical protein